MSDVTADQIRAMREETGRGLQECKRILQKQALLRELEQATTMDELKRVIRKLIT